MAIDPFAHCNLDPNFETSQCTWDTCCLAQSAFYYLPNYGANIFFAVLFGVILLPQLGLGIFYRTWGFMVGMLLGLALEVVGYAARVELHGFPWDKNQFLMSVQRSRVQPALSALLACLLSPRLTRAPAT